MNLDSINFIYAFILGCCVGSFINVLIIRMPKGQSLILPGSKCLRCGFSIRWFDNIPIISWIFLSGRCRNCHNKIAFTYPLIELLTGLLFILNIYSNPTLYENSPLFYREFLGFIFSFLCLSLAILDIKHFWLPDLLTIIGLIVGLTASLLVDFSSNVFEFSLTLNTFSAALLGFFLFYFLNLIGTKLFKKPVLGGGDAKFSALLGSWLGIKGLLISIWLSFNTAGIFVILALILKRIKTNQKIPFGVFLALSGLLVWHFGNNNILKTFNISL